MGDNDDKKTPYSYDRRPEDPAAQRLEAAITDGFRKYAEAHGFTDETLWKAFEAAGSRCQCTRKTCGHEGRCTETFTSGQHGTHWEAHHEVAKGAPSSTDLLSNCEILCIECHRNTRTFGVGTIKR